MREIKFRVFNTITKQMFYDGFIINDRGKIFFTEAVINDEISEQLKKVYDIDYPSVFDYGDYSFQFCQPMQFTGLKDKNGNGKEIYEGDIVIGATSFEKDNDEMHWTKEEPAIVKWNEKVSGFYPFFYNARWRCDVIGIEVIGNIYENPELLKGEK